MKAEEHLTIGDCLKLYEEEGIMGLVEKVKEISFKAGTRVVIDLLYRWCNQPFNHDEFTEELDRLGIDWSK